MSCTVGCTRCYETTLNNELKNSGEVRWSKPKSNKWLRDWNTLMKRVYFCFRIHSLSFITVNWILFCSGVDIFVCFMPVNLFWNKQQDGKCRWWKGKAQSIFFLLLCLFSPSGGSKDGCVSLLRIVRFHPKTVCQLEWLHRTLDLREFRLGSLNVVTYLNASGQTQQQNAPCCKYIAVITEEHCP